MTSKGHVPMKKFYGSLSSAAFLGLVVLSTVCAGALAQGRTVPMPGPHPVTLALTFDATQANITSSNRFWLTGGSAELNAEVYHGFGITAAITGLRTADSGGGVPVNLLVAAFGPSYALHRKTGRHAVTVFANGLIGEADGFSGVFPAPGGPMSSASSFAAQVGGGIDLDLSNRIGLRCFKANWLRTALPNSTTNVQNDLRLGAGVVFRFGHIVP